MPHFAERLTQRTRFLAYGSGKAHACDIQVAFGYDFEHFSIQCEDLRLLLGYASCCDLTRNLRIKLWRHKVANGGEITLIICCLQLPEVQLRVVDKLLGIESSGVGATSDQWFGCSGSAKIARHIARSRWCDIP